MQHKDQLS